MPSRILNSRLFLLLAGEAEVIDGPKSCRLARLERESQPRQESLNRPGPQAVVNPLGLLVREAAGHVLLGVRAGDDVNRLLLLLQRTNDFP